MTRSDARSFHQPPPRHAAPARRQPVQAPVIDDEEEMFDLFEDEDEQEAATTAEPEPLVLSYWNNRFATRHTGELPRAASSAPQTAARPHTPRPRPVQEEQDDDRQALPVAHRPARRRRSGVLYTLAGMLSMAGLVVGLNSLGAWWQGVQDDWHYGMPRTYQMDAVVGHHHDSAARVYPGPLLTGPHKDEVVVTLSIADVDHDGTPDLIVHVGESEFVLYNNGHDDQFHSTQTSK